MAYSPDPTVVTEPLDSTDARTAAAEFRALKAYIAGLTLGNQNAALYRKNLLDNPCFAIKQRPFLAGAIAVDSYITDRWKLKRNFSSSINGAVYPGATNLNPSGGDNYLAVGAQVAAVPTVAQYIGFEQVLEWNNVDHLSPGWAHAKTITLSGWINAPTTGILPVYVQNPARTRSWVGTITVTAATTWQRFEVVIPLDITGAWTPAAATDAGLIVGFSLACGSNFQTGSPGTWLAGDIRSRTGQVNFLATDGWVTYFSGLQLEVGGAATTFEKRHHATELAICERYYEISPKDITAGLPLVTDPQGVYAAVNVNGTGTNRWPFHFRTKKRVIPSMTFPIAARNITNNSTGGTPTLATGCLSEAGGIVNCVGGASWAASHGAMFMYIADADF